MDSQEELANGLRRLTDALAPNHARRLSIVRDGAKPRVACAQERDVGRDRLQKSGERKEGETGAALSANAAVDIAG
jgi:hypothetical protein